MKPLNCAATRRRLQAFHDRELAVTDQIAVSAHLEWCDGCAVEFADLRVIGNALRATSPGRDTLANDEASVFTATVVNRLKAEETVSLATRVRSMFEDMHLVYAGLGAASAAAVCVLIMLSMMRFATNERPDSLAAIMSLLASPLECESTPSSTELAESSGCRERWVARFQRANETAEQDAIFTLESVISRHGRLANLEGLRRGRQPAVADAKLIEGLLEVVSRSRLESVPVLRVPDLAGMMMLVEHATVRATPSKPADLPLPPKKRAETATRIGRAVRA
jgi:anti-sigma factor RsiW